MIGSSRIGCALRAASLTAIEPAILDALLDRPDVLLRDRAADDVVLEDEPRARFARLEVNDHMAVLPAAAGLADELPFDVFDPLPYGLAIGDLRAADVRVHFELTPHPLDDDLEVQLAHAADDRLRRLGVGMYAKRGI